MQPVVSLRAQEGVVICSITRNARMQSIVVVPKGKAKRERVLLKY